VQAIAFIMRQTDYSDEVANERLDELKDPMKVIQEYLGESKIQTTQPVCNSKNKMKYGEIRKFMDAGARQYNRQKEINERRRKYQEYIEQQQQQQQQQQDQQQQQQDQQQPANE
jgi:predicted ribosome quality control (RQC) complex YloA/Tae2 family protein